MIGFNLARRGLLNPGELRAWTSGVKEAVHAAVKTGMQKGGRELAGHVRANIAASLKIKRRGFLNSFRPKIFDKKPGRLPALLIGSKVSWSGIFEHGATINGHLVVPFTNTVGHPGAKAWKAFLAEALRARQGMVKNVRGRKILFLRNADARAGAAASISHRSRVRFRAGRRAKPNDLVPVAFLLSSVTLRKRIDVAGTVERHLGELARAIKTELDKV